MKAILKIVAAGSVLIGSIGCSGFLTGGEISNDPNRPTVANAKQIFVGVQSNIWASYAGDLTRIVAMFDQQALGASSQSIPTYNYSITEQTTNGQHTQFYSAGGLVDVRKLQDAARGIEDSLLLGIAQVQESLLMSLVADIFGDVVYSEALKGGNPPLDKQMDVYAALLLLLDTAIDNISTTAVTNSGPREADLVYWTGSEPAELAAQKAKWVALAHSLKARIYMHTAELIPANYALARDEAAQGIQTDAGSYRTVYSGVSGEQNMLYQFAIVQRPGQLVPNPFIISLMTTPADPRFNSYFKVVTGGHDYADAFVAPTKSQYIFSADENTLIWAEAAFRAGPAGAALTQLNRYRTANGLGTGAEVGNNLLRAILTQKYIALFHQVEPYNDYKRTCFPNLSPVTGTRIPARLFYDSNERNTNPSLPSTADQPIRNQNDPANATDPFGAPCLGQ